MSNKMQKLLNLKSTHHIEIVDAWSCMDLLEEDEIGYKDEDNLKKGVARYINQLKDAGAESIRTTWRVKDYKLIAIIEWLTYESA